ncbi:uncharacterized protein LOC129218657 [Uloborus diversus]|uniref:uncharacterized protein LOC129218657 n=1 Tax=Uloborus diversus TaxID=327109 RepID=UPI0024096CC6|nr:uncharacterized protein LOC129218657 [Uloborus diversus]XP_054708953.1 uncharacterized protein LOC129218657 [Uloborus diversus]
MFQHIFLIACLAVSALASRSANQYIENVIQTSLPNEVRALGLDPAPLVNFNVQFGPQTVYGSQGQANFTQGNVTGLTRVQRASECSGPTNFRGEITINCTLSLFPVTTGHKVWIRNGTNTFVSRSVGNVDKTLVHVVIAGYPQNYVGSVKSFTITRLGQVRPSFVNFPAPLNKYLKVLKDVYQSQVTSQLYNIVQQRFVYALGRAIANKPMPRQ